MKFEKQAVPGTLIRRYKRFLADIELAGGTVVTAHCANTGSMKQVAEPGSQVILTVNDNPRRKTRYDWQMIQVNGRWAGINTAVPNRLLYEGFEYGLVPQFRGFDSIQMEVPYGSNSRADAVLSSTNGRMYVEAKNVTLVEDECALFPDAVTARGAKHLTELSRMVNEGHRAAMFFVSQRMDAECIGIATYIDPHYARCLTEAVETGVEVISWRARIMPDEIALDRELPFVMPR